MNVNMAVILGTRVHGPYFRLSTFLICIEFVYLYFPVLFVSISQVIGCEDRLQNDLYCVGGVKLYSNQPNHGP